MCTLTIIRPSDDPDVVRLICNRDESRRRPEALPPWPTATADNRLQVVWPVDPPSGGTWLAAASTGLAMVLLNRNEPNLRPSEGAQSRGVVIPQLWHHPNLADMLDAACKLPVARFAPFRLVLVDRRGWAELAADGRSITVRAQGSLERPQLFTSSGLGDHLVDPPRRKLFQTMLLDQPATRAVQDALHRHAWPDRPELSVCMARRDARTVSRTTVEIGPARVVVQYDAGPALERRSTTMLPLLG